MADPNKRAYDNNNQALLEAATFQLDAEGLGLDGKIPGLSGISGKSEQSEGNNETSGAGKSIGGEMGEQAGRAAGTYIAGPVGGEVGAKAGRMVGEMAGDKAEQQLGDAMNNPTGQLIPGMKLLNK